MLTSLWTTEEFIANFHDYLNQLNPTLERLFSMNTETLVSTPGAKQEIIKVFYVLRGVLRGLNQSKHFNLFFDWFYPQYLAVIIEGSLRAFYTDDDVVMVVLKFLTELVHNRNNRLRFDTWSINGLIVFKETAKYVVELLRQWDCMRAKATSNDQYLSKWKYVRQFVDLYHKMISGNYINFAICEYYNDDIFSVLTQCIFTMISSASVRQLKAYEKVNQKVFTMVNHFFQHHLEIMFLKFDVPLIEGTL